MGKLMGEHRNPAQLSAAEQARRQERLLGLLQPLHDRARRTARRLCASAADGDDLFQEAVLRAFYHLPSLREESRFGGWFYAVMLSVHRARSRVSFWRRFLPLEGAGSAAGEPRGGSAWERSTDLPPALAEEARGRAQRLALALQQLPAEQREAVVLFEVEGFSIEEIAALQQASVNAVKSRLHRGRQRLRQHYEALGDDFGDEPAAPDPAAASPPDCRPAALPLPRPAKEVFHE